MSTGPKILIVGLEGSWVGIARLPRALQHAGFEVGVASFENSFLAATRFRDRFFPLPPEVDGETLLHRLEMIVAEWRPDLLMPGDELTVAFLSRIYKKIRSKNPLAVLLKRSMGNPEALKEAASKHRTLEKATQLGIRVPASRLIRNRNGIVNFARQSGFPLVLKKSFGWGGNKVAICRNESEAIQVWSRWSRKLGWRYRFRAWRKRTREYRLESHWLFTDNTIIANEFISGTPAMCLAVAFEGRMLAALTAIKERCFPAELSPSSVVRLVRNEEMRCAAEKLLSSWKFTGFIGFDFIVNSRAEASLIECNPRPTSIAHLGDLVGEDLCRALYCAFTFRPMPQMKQNKELIVAHFPSEQLRDPASRFLTEGLHDVPHDDPDLLQLIYQSLQTQPEVGL